MQIGQAMKVMKKYQSSKEKMLLIELKKFAKFVAPMM
jgi:hypothetical protein